MRLRLKNLKAAYDRFGEAPMAIGAISLTIFFCILVLMTVNCGLVVNLSLLGLTVVGLFSYLFVQMRWSKELFYRTHIRRESGLQKFRVGYVFVAAIALIAALIGTVSLQVFLLTLPLWIVILMAMAQVLFYPVRRLILVKLGKTLTPISLNLFTNAATIMVIGLLTTVLLIVGKVFEMSGSMGDLAQGPPSEMAAHVKATVNFDPIVFQHIGRTLMMLDLELLRFTFMMDGPIAWFVRVFFLMPSAAATFTVAALHAGTFYFVSRSIGQQTQDPVEDPDIRL